MLSLISFQDALLSLFSPLVCFLTNVFAGVHGMSGVGKHVMTLMLDLGVALTVLRIVPRAVEPITVAVSAGRRRIVVTAASGCVVCAT